MEYIRKGADKPTRAELERAMLRLAAKKKPVITETIKRPSQKVKK